MSANCFSFFHTRTGASLLDPIGELPSSRPSGLDSCTGTNIHYRPDRPCMYCPYLRPSPWI